MRRFNNREECYRYYAKIRGFVAIIMFLISVVPVLIASVLLKNMWLLIGGIAELLSIIALRFVFEKIEIFIDNTEFEECSKYPHWWEI